MSSTTSPKLIGLCTFLFLASALITLSLRSSHYSNHWPALTSESSLLQRPGPAHRQSRVAFATFLAGAAADNDEAAVDDNADGYYLGARVLAYQLLHSPSIGTNSSIPFLVLVTEDVSERKRKRLTLDGATVVVVDKLVAEWVHPGADRWRDVLAKLRLFELTSYAKICFIDADTLVTKRLDGVFYDEATMLQMTLSNPAELKDDEAPLPRSFMFASKPDAWGYEHAYPPVPPESDYLNCGFFVFTPSKELFAYYMSLLAIKDRFYPAFPEQNLLNYAHRKEGNMPWSHLWYGWNMNWPTVKDLEGGE
ncbi:hypothetical protein LTR04_002549 [Oleoguttula sp. CCFEE 6159]|nr:hypothetical protein LTR04_002549 [Oleoguttula sp. CCFEE 6159]